MISWSSSRSVSADSKMWCRSEFREMFRASHQMQQETQTHNAVASLNQVKCGKVFFIKPLLHLSAIQSVVMLNIPYLYWHGHFFYCIHYYVHLSHEAVSSTLALNTVMTV